MSVPTRKKKKSCSREIKSSSVSSIIALEFVCIHTHIDIHA